MVNRVPSSNRLRVAVIDADVRIRSNISWILRTDSLIEFVGAYAGGQDALPDLPRLRADVILTDLSLPDIDGIVCIQKLVSAIPGAKIVVLTSNRDDASIFQALAAGVGGYLLKPFQSSELLGAIHDVADGGAPMSGFIARRVIQFFRPSLREHSDLTPREDQVLNLMARGLTYKEIAEELSITFSTVRTYIERAYDKFQVRSKPAAIAKYLLNGKMSPMVNIAEVGVPNRWGPAAF